MVSDAPDPSPGWQAQALAARLVGEGRQDTPAARRRKRRVREYARALYEGRPLQDAQRRWLLRWLEYAAMRSGRQGRSAQRFLNWLIATGPR